MRFSTISIIVITFIIYTVKIENGKVLAITVAPIAIDPLEVIKEGIELNEEAMKTMKDVFESSIIPIATTIDPITTIDNKTPIDYIKRGVELSLEVMKTLQDAIESSSIMKKIAIEIKKIKLINEYLSKTEKQLVTDAKVQLAHAENHFTTLRIELTELAELTKATTTKLIKTINRLSDDPPKFNQQFEVIFKRFITLMNLTSIKLKEAKGKYDKMSEKLAEAKGKLGAFQDVVETLDNAHSERYAIYADKLRTEAYLKTGLCAIFLPSCAIAYPIVVGIVETRLKEYSNEVVGLKKNTKNIAESVTGMVAKLTAKDKELKEELRLVITWENEVIQAKQNYGLTPITEAIEEILAFKQLAIDDFQDLYDAADAFNKWILREN